MVVVMMLTCFQNSIYREKNSKKRNLGFFLSQFLDVAMQYMHLVLDEGRQNYEFSAAADRQLNRMHKNVCHMFTI